MSILSTIADAVFFLWIYAFAACSVVVMLTMITGIIQGIWRSCRRNRRTP